MPKQDPFIRVLLVDDSVEDAEQLVGHLRNAGLSVRPRRAVTREEVAKTVTDQQIDLLLARPHAAAGTPAELVATINRLDIDCPLLVLVPKIDNRELLQSVRDGARAVVLASDPEHLVATVKREFDDLSQRRALRRLDAALKESERRCEALLDSSRDPIAFVHEGMHVRTNRAYREMFGFDDAQDIDGTPILDLIAANAADGFKSLLRDLSRGKKPPMELKIEARKSNGATFEAVMEFSAATFEGEPCQQITFRRSHHPSSAPLGTDLVSGLRDRRSFLHELDRAVSEVASGRNDLAVLYLEPDRWQHVVETVGIANADLVIADLAERAREVAGPDDVAARFSDSALILLTRGHTHDDAVLLAQALRRKFEGHFFEAGERSVPLPISVGAVLLGEKIANAEAILAAAARALKQAQDAGGNRVQVHDPAAQDKAELAAQNQRLVDIRTALEKDGFLLMFQPIVNLHGSDGEFYETLVRLRSPHGVLLPAEFFPIAEKHGLLPAIDRWVIATAINTLAERQRAKRRTVLFVKVTVPTMEDGGFLPWLAAQLKAHRVPGDRVVFEIPESKATTNLRQVRAFQKGLAQLHIGLALQQFGSGINSFQLLKHLDCNYLKIDRSYMDNLPRNPENQQRVKQICDQAHSAGKLTIAEFVEDADSMAILFGFGVNFVQGNFLQEPEKVMAYEFGH